MTLKQIPIKSLKAGMHITKLDIPWMESPFIRHHLTIKSANDIKKLLNAGVKNVTIDTSKGTDVVACLQETLKKDVEPSNNAKVFKKVTLEQELNVAKKLRGSITSLAENINEALKNDKAIGLEQVAPLIEGTLKSLGRNDQAMTTLVNMQRKAVNLSTHAFATFCLALNLSIKMNLDASAQQALGLAALFHDSGWLKLPLNLLGKNSAYTANERKLTEQHIAIGSKLLEKNCELPELAMRIIEEHHEYCNGLGYPQKLTGNEIHSLSKLFCIIDLYDELVHGLLDQPAMTPNGALAYLYKKTKQDCLDESIVSNLVVILGVYPIGSIVQLSNKEKGLVFEINRDQPKEPKVKIYYDKSGTAHAEPRIIDLANQKGQSFLVVTNVLDSKVQGTDPAHLMELT
tara:strand:- start:14445 stop:15650 length:1206 start_codon:yes stop_codon:yes gene_type:complete